jgi:hypothetical protein
MMKGHYMNINKRIQLKILSTLTNRFRNTPADGHSLFLKNVIKLLPNYMVSYPRK